MVLGIVFLAILLLDQVSKAVVFALIESPPQTVTIIPGFLEFRCVRNTGASYGLFAGWDFAPTFLAIVTGVALVVMLIVLVKLQRSKRFLRSALVIIMAGAAGNLVDRIVDGGVRDFIDLSVGNISFLNFNCNVADIAVTVGAVMLVLALLFIDRDSLVRSIRQSRREKQEVLAAAAELESAGGETDNDLGAAPAQSAAAVSEEETVPEKETAAEGGAGKERDERGG